MSYDAGRYGRAVGDYDSLYPGDPSSNAAAVDLLVSLARDFDDRSVLEFGIGTGRLAIPLAERGVRVAGVEGSESMIANLRAKPGGSPLDVVLGDYRDARVAGGQFAVVVLAFNGIFDPRGTSVQLDIFRNAKGHLVRGGYFVVESWVMSERERNGSWSVVPRYVAEGHVEFQLSRYDLATNIIHRTLLHVRNNGNQFVTVTDTYASPGELDVMGIATGFHRVARYASWGGDPFQVSSTNAISIFQLA